jgi:YVTN family beta-propeller protein
MTPRSPLALLTLLALLGSGCPSDSTDKPDDTGPEGDSDTLEDSDACEPTPEHPSNGVDDDCDGEVDEAPVALSEPVLVAEYSHNARMISCEAGHLFLPDNGNDQLLVVDTTTHQVISQLPAGSYPYYVVSAEGWTVASNAYGTTVTIVDSASATVQRELRVGEYPWGVAILDGVLYVNSFTAADPYVQRVDLASGSLLERFDGESGPDRMAGVSGHIYLINGRGMGNDADDAVSIHQADGTLVDRLETGGGLYDIVAHGNGKVYVTAQADDEVIEIDPTTQAETARFPTGPAPNGIASHGELLFVVNRDGPSLTVIHPDQGWTFDADLSGYATTIASPRGVAACDGGALYIEADDKVVGFPGAFTSE